MSEDIFKLHGVRRRLLTTTWATLLVWGAAAERQRKFKAGGGDIKDFAVDMAAVGDAVTIIRGSLLRSSGPYNRVFAHLARLVEGGFATYTDRGFVISPMGEAVWGQLFAGGLDEFVLNAHSKHTAASLLIWAFLKEVNPGTSWTTEALSRRTPLSKGQVSEALRNLRRGVDVFDAKGQAHPLPADTVLYQGDSRWVLDTQTTLNFGSGDKGNIWDVILSGAKDVILSVTKEESSTGTLTEHGIGTIIPKSPKTAKTPKTPKSANVPKAEPAVSAQDTVDTEDVPTDAFPKDPPAMITLDTQFDTVLDKEAAYLGLSNGAQVLNRYLNDEWLPNMLKTQEKREKLRGKMLEKHFASERALIQANKKKLRQDQDRIQELKTQLAQAEVRYASRALSVERQEAALRAKIEAKLEAGC